MGCGASQPQVSPESKAIDQELKKQQARMQREIKLLLLGSGGSGKSTFAKQMKVMFLGGFNEKERMLFVEFIHLNVLNGLKMVVRAMSDRQLEPENKELLKTFEMVKFMTPSHGNVEIVTPQMGEELQKFWKDPQVQHVWDTYADARGDESVQYFFNDLERVVCQAGFIPTLDDVLHVRMKTTGIKELNFAHEGFTFRVVDVGGQKSERRKWIHCFQDVTAVIFVSSLNDYNLTLEEDPTVNRMVDSLDLFSKVINNKWFEKVNIILFLNKVDLFNVKVQSVKVNQFFPDYPADKKQTDKDVIQFFLSKFTSIAKERTVSGLAVVVVVVGFFLNHPSFCPPASSSHCGCHGSKQHRESLEVCPCIVRPVHGARVCCINE
jgi:GTPase SAR1 family protein